jgi:caffeoyl-CoA O-methyltransferase
MQASVMADSTSRSGAAYSSREILEWVAKVHAPHDESLAAAFATPERSSIPAIQVGPLEGRALELLATMVRATKIVEVGTLAGYSAIWLARGLAPGGHLWTVEYETKHAALAQKNIAHAGLADRVTIARGSARDVLPTLEGHGPFDLVFVDADKASYDFYGDWAFANLRPGGLLLGDNAFFFGNLLGAGDDAEAMRRFHERAAGRFLSTCFATPDGLLVGVKRA